METDGSLTRGMLFGILLTRGTASPLISPTAHNQPNCCVVESVIWASRFQSCPFITVSDERLENLRAEMDIKQFCIPVHYKTLDKISGSFIENEKTSLGK